MMFKKEIQRNSAIVWVINPKDTETAKIPWTMFQEKGFMLLEKMSSSFFLDQMAEKKKCAS